MDTSDYVTIHYDQDLFAIVDSKSNCVLDFGIATKVKYAEIFAYKSSGSLKATDICLAPNEKFEENLPFPPSTKSLESKELEVYKEKWISDSNVWDDISSEQGDDESEQSCFDR